MHNLLNENKRPRISLLSLWSLVLLFLIMLLPNLCFAGVGESIAEWLNAKGLNPQLVVFLVAMVPIVELRGAVPIGNNLFNLPIWQTLILSIIGNMLPILLVLLLLKKMINLLGDIPIFRSFFEWLFKRTKSKSGLIARFEFWGLVIFVGIPLPMTGAWTGSVAAVLLAMPYWRALLGIFLGVLIAAAIVISLSLLRWWGVLIAAIALLLILIQQVLTAIRKPRQT